MGRRQRRLQHGDTLRNTAALCRHTDVLKGKHNKMATQAQSFSESQALGKVPEGFAQLPRDQNARHYGFCFIRMST
jgi:hypothetical protein